MSSGHSFSNVSASFPLEFEIEEGPFKYEIGESLINHGSGLEPQYELRFRGRLHDTGTGTTEDVEILAYCSGMNFPNQGPPGIVRVWLVLQDYAQRFGCSGVHYDYYNRTRKGMPPLELRRMNCAQ